MGVGHGCLALLKFGSCGFLNAAAQVRLCLRLAEGTQAQAGSAFAACRLSSVRSACLAQTAAVRQSSGAAAGGRCCALSIVNDRGALHANPTGPFQIGDRLCCAAAGGHSQGAGHADGGPGVHQPPPVLPPVWLAFTRQQVTHSAAVQLLGGTAKGLAMLTVDQEYINRFRARPGGQGRRVLWGLQAAGVGIYEGLIGASVLLFGSKTVLFVCC